MKNNLVKNRAMYIIALFILSINFTFSQIDQINDKCIWISRDELINKESIKSALIFASESGFNKVFLQVRGRGDAFYNSEIVVKNEMIDPLLAPCLFKDALTGITPQEHSGNGIPYNTAFKQELKLRAPILS